jgi:hypothetical protein
MRKLMTVATAFALCGVAHAESTEELKALLDQAMKTIQDLQARVKALEEQNLKEEGPAAVTPPPKVLSPVVAPPVAAPNAAAQTDAPKADKVQTEIYGQVMLDAIYDFRRMNPDWAATLRPSQIPVGCPGAPGCGKNESFLMSVRQSSLGARAFIPTPQGPIKTDLAFDLFGTDGGTHIHWLRAWGELGIWGAGQSDSNFMDVDVFPATIDYWGPPGMVFIRNPQVRVTPYSRDGVMWAVSLEAPNSVVDTGKLTAVDPSLGAGIASHNRLPDLVGSFRLDRDWGHVRAAAILRQVGYHTTTTPDGNPSGQKPGYGLNASGVLKAFGNDRISWQVAGGTAIATYMNDGGSDLAPNAQLRAQAVQSLGWLAYYNHSWADRWTSAFGYSQHVQDNTEGQLGTAFHRGSYGSLNGLYAPSKNLLTGAEYIWGRRENKDGSSAADYRLQFSTRVTF